jgi:hypothetical protein
MEAERRKRRQKKEKAAATGSVGTAPSIIGTNALNPRGCYPFDINKPSLTSSAVENFVSGA